MLLVDDSAETLDVFGTLLELEGARVVSANGAVRALALTDTHEFDLILSDIGMPDMDGYQLVTELRRRPRTARVPAFALSGFGDRRGVERALAAGFQAYIDKPVSLDAVLQAMARAQRPEET